VRARRLEHRRQVRRSAISAGWAVFLACQAPALSAHAFSDPFAYTEPPEAGGGGGRWFTGSSADGYGCDACHGGAPGADLAIAGLPLAGFAPGQAYEITITWPPTTPNLVLIAELTTEQRSGAGTLALPRPDALRPEEVCSGEEMGFPSSEIHQAELGRQLVSVIDCGARALRFLWTAPSLITGSAWLDVGFVRSNVDGDVTGDGVTMVRRAIPPANAGGAERRVATSGCSASPGVRSSGAHAGVALWAALLVAVLRAGAWRSA
jgi:hypothetical protein